MIFDVARVRAGYPALRDGHAYLDGAAGTQVPVPVIDAIASAYRAGIGNTGGAFAASERAAVIVAECRRAVADLVGGVPSGVLLGPSMTALTYRISAALARGWAPGDEVVVSRLDHDANIRPWVQAASRAGAVVRRAEVDVATGELPVSQYADLVGARTRLVAVTAASNVLGTRPDVAAIAGIAHAAGGRAPGLARGQRVERRQLRLRAVHGPRPEAGRGGAGRPGALQRRLRRRPPADRRRRPGGRVPLTTGRCTL